MNRYPAPDLNDLPADYDVDDLLPAIRGGLTIDGLVRSYGEGSADTPQALINSNGYVEVFLSLCNELCPAIGEAVVGAAEPDGATACAALVERCADLGLAAERMGYVHVQDALAQLARAAERGPVAAAELPELEVALYAALVPIEAAYRATSATPIDVAVASLYQRACAAVVLADVAELHALLEQARPPLAAVHQRFARLRAACAYLELPHASEGLLSHEDALGRIWERGRSRFAMHWRGLATSSLKRPMRELCTSLGSTTERYLLTHGVRGHWRHLMIRR